jgi:hypothetical protein
VDELWKNPEPSHDSGTNHYQNLNSYYSVDKNFTDHRILQIGSNRAYNKCWVAFSDAYKDIIYVVTENNYVYAFSVDNGKVKCKSDNTYNNIKSFFAVSILEKDYIFMECGNEKVYLCCDYGWNLFEYGPYNDSYDAIPPETKNILYDTYRGVNNAISLLYLISIRLIKVFPNHGIDMTVFRLYMVNKYFNEVKYDNYIRDPRSSDIIYRMTADELVMVNEKTNNETIIANCMGNNISMKICPNHDYDMLAYASNGKLHIITRSR